MNKNILNTQNTHLFVEENIEVIKQDNKSSAIIIEAINSDDQPVNKSHTIVTCQSEHKKLLEQDNSDGDNNDDNNSEAIKKASSLTNESLLYEAVPRIVKDSIRIIDKKENEKIPFKSIVHFDKRVLIRYSGLTQIIINIISIIMVISILFCDCFRKPRIKYEFYLDGDEMTIKPTKKYIVTECGPQYYLIFVSILSIIIQTIFFLSYSFHIVEAFNGFPWITSECIIYPIEAFQYFIGSILVLIHGGWMVLLAVLGIVNCLLYSSLSLIKYRKYKSEEPAQERTNDPDGNQLRSIYPNYRFSFKKL